MTFEPSLSWLKLSDNENKGEPVYVRVDQIQVFGADGYGSRIQLSSGIYVLVSESPEEVGARLVELVNGLS